MVYCRLETGIARSKFHRRARCGLTCINLRRAGEGEDYAGGAIMAPYAGVFQFLMFFGASQSGGMLESGLVRTQPGGGASLQNSAHAATRLVFDPVAAAGIARRYAGCDVPA